MDNEDRYRLALEQLVEVTEEIRGELLRYRASDRLSEHFVALRLLLPEGRRESWQYRYGSAVKRVNMLCAELEHLAPVAPCYMPCRKRLLQAVEQLESSLLDGLGTALRKTLGDTNAKAVSRD